ncbi:MAG: type II toxin-antitoxin system VapC family toxin [Anaerolineae bacterium]
MSILFLVSSALVKRYLSEAGSAWVVAVTNPPTENAIVVAEITRVEAAAAIAARHRAPSGISRIERDELVQLLLRHFDDEYDLAALTPKIISRAVALTQSHRLRGYDAIQLATALDVHETAVAAGLGSVTFVAADDDLIAAARVEGLAADNPNRRN